MKNPCDRNCPRREAGCHAKCEAYLAWLEEQKTAKQAEAEVRKRNDDYAQYAYRNQQRVKERRRRK